MPVVNKHTRGGWVIAHFVASGAVYLNSANALLGANSKGETVTKMNIVSAEWSVGNNAHWTVSRGANTILNLTDGQHVFDMSDSRQLDNLGGNPTANVVVTKVGSGPGTLILKLHKQVQITGNGSQY